MSNGNWQQLEAIWREGVAAVGGYHAVESWLSAHDIVTPDLILAVGKAAEPMYLAAAARFGRGVPHLVVTKHDHFRELTEGPDAIAAAHPIPDADSLRAGKALARRVAGARPGARLLFLVSGGASALAELPAPGMSLADLAALNDRLVGGGLTIAEINAERRKVSRLKGGKLLAGFHGRSVVTLAISDVEGDDIGVIGSGIGAMPTRGPVDYRAEIVASNRIARAAAVRAATQMGLTVRTEEECLYGDVADAARTVGTALRESRTGIWIFGGEPTVTLPPNPGLGGRNQSLALHIAREVAGMKGVAVLVAGTDGTDGPTDAAGAFVGGETWCADAGMALARADAWHWLKENGGLFVTGPTGTNVMDLVVAMRWVQT